MLVKYIVFSSSVNFYFTNSIFLDKSNFSRREVKYEGSELWYMLNSLLMIRCQVVDHSYYHSIFVY